MDPRAKKTDNDFQGVKTGVGGCVMDGRLGWAEVELLKTRGKDLEQLMRNMDQAGGRR